LPPHPISSQMRHHLFLATHEALTNILKHSGATRASISIISATDSFELKICDDGKGFKTVTGSPAPSGEGLNNIRRRLEAMGGECSIESAAGQGTTIRFIVPLHHLANGFKKL